ncbi:unnamed protein product, partial [marine sediment metagenome]
MDEAKIALIAFCIGTKLSRGPTQIESVPLSDEINGAMESVNLEFITTTHEEVEHVADLLAPL